VSHVTIYHRAQCSTSRGALDVLREHGVEPVVVDYVAAGWTKDQLKALFKAMKVRPRDMLRVNGTPAEELGLTDPAVSDARLLTAMVKHPILVQRPIVVGPKGTILARPIEKALDVL